MRILRLISMLSSSMMMMMMMVALMLSSSSVNADSTQDANQYSFGENPNIKNHKMYWADSKAVLNDLSEFHALYIKFHSCSWSPNQAYFDDDGENRDGDENWYQGRTPYYAANAGFSLYGSKGMSSLLNLGGACHGGTYINSFFTNNGADVLIQALGISNVDTGLGYCQEYSENGNNNNRRLGSRQRQRQLSDSSDSEDGDETVYPQSAMMGCSQEGDFVTALFSDDYCEGQYFLNISDSYDSSISDYNKAMHNKMDCKKIYNGNEVETDNGYTSMAHEVLQQSTVCDVSVNPSCPDPWGKQTKYNKAFMLAQGGRSNYYEMVVRKPLLYLSNVSFCLGLLLLIGAYALNNKQRIQNNRIKSSKSLEDSDGDSTENSKPRSFMRAFCMVAYKDFRYSLKRARKARKAARLAKRQEEYRSNMIGKHDTDGDNIGDDNMDGDKAGRSRSKSKGRRSKSEGRSKSRSQRRKQEKLDQRMQKLNEQEQSAELELRQRQRQLKQQQAGKVPPQAIRGRSSKAIGGNKSPKAIRLNESYESSQFSAPSEEDDSRSERIPNLS